MKRLTPVFLISIVILISCKEKITDPSLFLISKDGRYGYIDIGGNTVIEPVFLSGGEFAEGLASARTAGTYGYIDRTGNFIIPPQFDYATEFSEGKAVVYLNGKPLYIDKKGKKLFDFNFMELTSFQNGRAFVKTSTGKFGIIDTSGKLIADTVYRRIDMPVHGTCVVEGLNHLPNGDEEKGMKAVYEVGVIDSLGRFLIPYGVYDEIGNFENGYFKVELPELSGSNGTSASQGFVDKTGKLVVSRANGKNTWIDGNLSCGLAKISLYKFDKGEDEDSYSTDNSYEGFINVKGELVVNDTSFEYANDFSNNRAFVKHKDGDYRLINTKGKTISSASFSGLVGEGFRNGIAFVEQNDKYGVIDTSANFMIKPQFEEIEILDDNFFLYSERTKNSDDKYETSYGIARKDGTILLKPIINNYDRQGFKNGLLRCSVKNKLTYINKDGVIVWQASSPDQQIVSPLNIDYMNRGNFYADSERNDHDLGGYGGSDNQPRVISSSDHFTPGALSVEVRPESSETIDGRIAGMKVFIANSLAGKIEFSAQDSRLDMKVQAKDKHGSWRDIEYLPSSWCGNSYHTLTLQANHFWTFTTPVYDGDFKTKLRIALTYIDPYSKSDSRRNRKEVTVYSNEYDGSVNPGQFWRKQEYFPNGIMDPYND